MTRKAISIQGSWVAVSQAHDEAAARNPLLSTHLRVLAAARSRLEFSGHAHFGRQELGTIVSKVAKDTGELTRLSPSALTRAIKHLVDGDQLMDGSWSECLRLPLFAVQNGTGRSRPGPPCPQMPKGNLYARS